jgi:hypothetical protein
MVVIEGAEKSGISFWYPFYSNGLWLSGKPLKVIEWEGFKKWLPIRAAINVVLFGFGLTLLDHDFYTDARFNVFGTVVLISTVFRLWIYMPRLGIRLTRTLSFKLSPLSAIDFCGTYAVLSLLFFVYSAETEAQHLSGIAGVVGSFLLVFALMPLCAGLAFLLGVGRR